TIVARTRLPPAIVTATSPSSASASSAVTIRPGFHANPDDSARCEWTDTTDAAAAPTTPAREAESVVSEVRSGIAGIGISLNVIPNMRMPALAAYCPGGEAAPSMVDTADR